MVEYWACLRDKLEDDEITETKYYLKEIKFPMNSINPDIEYTVSLNLDDDDHLLVQNLDEDEKATETAELLKGLFPLVCEVEEENEEGIKSLLAH